MSMLTFLTVCIIFSVLQDLTIRRICRRSRVTLGGYFRPKFSRRRCLWRAHFAEDVDQNLICISVPRRGNGRRRNAYFYKLNEPIRFFMGDIKIKTCTDAISREARRKSSGLIILQKNTP